MQLYLVSAHGPRETYFVDETRMSVWTVLQQNPVAPNTIRSQFAFPTMGLVAPIEQGEHNLRVGELIARHVANNGLFLRYQNWEAEHRQQRTQAPEARYT
jgi:hypothetical protein